MSGRNDKFINVKRLRSLLGSSRRAAQTHRLLPASHWRPNHTAILSPQDMPALIRTPQTDVNSDPVTPPSGRHDSTPYFSLPESVFSNSSLLHTHICSHIELHTKPTVLADWQELQTVRLHRLHFKPTTTNWQPTEGWLLAGNTCFIYQPAGICPAHYGCDVGWMKLWSLFEWI